LITPGLCLASKRPWKTQYKADFLPAQAVLSRAGVQNYAVDREERVSSPFQAI
jgi:hypothetical protein